MFKVKSLKSYDKNNSYVHVAKNLHGTYISLMHKISVSVFYFRREIKLCPKYQRHQNFYMQCNFMYFDREK